VALIYASCIASFVLVVLFSRHVSLRIAVIATGFGALFLLWLAGDRTLFWAVPASFALAFALSAFALWLRTRRARAIALGICLGALASLWMLGRSLEQRGWRDVDGYADCWPYCNRWHLLGSGLHWVPLIVGLALILIVGLAEFAEVSPWKRRRVSKPEARMT
jgi:hypothetical protein